MNTICRLCKGSKWLTNITDMDIDGNKNFQTMITYCVGLEITSDNIMICTKCGKKIQKFYKFKQKCIKVDLELKIKDIHLKSGEKDQDLETIEEYVYVNEIEQLDLSNAERDHNSKVSTSDDAREAFNSFQCEFCGKIFKTNIHFKKHLLTHRRTQFYKCKYCPKLFKRAESNTIHMRSHFGIRPFICDICGKSSTKRQDLLRHMKIHSDERNHKCRACGRTFKRTGDLLSHVRTHSGARPYKCKLCEKDYTSHSGLRKHYNIHYKEDPDLKQGP